MKRIQFTSKELDMLNAMCAVASAGAWGDGDYAGDTWEAKDASKTFDSLRNKIWALQDRKEVKRIKSS